MKEARKSTAMKAKAKRLRNAREYVWKSLETAIFGVHYIRVYDMVAFESCVHLITEDRRFRRSRK